MKALFLTSRQLTAAVAELEGVRLPTRTLASWAASGLLVPGVDWQWKRRAERLYRLSDLARCRLIVRLRQAGFSVGRVRVVLLHLGQQERDVFKAGFNGVLTVRGWEVVVARPGEVACSVPSGQFMLPLSDVVQGNRDAAVKVSRVVAPPFGAGGRRRSNPAERSE